MTPAATTNLAPEFEYPPILRAIGLVVIAYGCFLAMEAVHELGHVMNAWSVGAHVVEVRFPLFGMSQTIVDPDPDPRLVTEGGPTWGVAIPVLACALARVIRRRVPEPLKFFAGFCLIANGVYMAVGRMWRNTDAGDLVRMNVPLTAIIAYGVAATLFGLAIWHRLTWLTWKRGTLGSRSKELAS